MLEELTTQELIIRGRKLENTIKHARQELKTIETILADRALSVPHERLAEDNREGRRARLRDGDQELTVLFESDILKASFAADSDVAGKVKEILSDSELAELFRNKTTIERIQKDGHKFRLSAAATLGPDRSAQLVDILKDRDKDGIVKSKTAIEW